MNGLDFIRAVKALAKERGISEDEIFEYMETALHAAFKKNNNATNSKVKIDRETGEIKVVAYKVVVDEINMEDEEDAQILLEELGDNPNHLKVGDVIEEEVTPKDFGRVAASTCKQVFTQKVREAERESIMKEFEDKEGELMVGTLAREVLSVPKPQITPAQAAASTEWWRNASRRWTLLMCSSTTGKGSERMQSCRAIEVCVYAPAFSATPSTPSSAACCRRSMSRPSTLLWK